MKDFVKTYSKNSILTSILLIVLALFLIFKPSASLNFLMIVIGIVLAINGAYHTISYFRSSKELKMFSFELVEGILSLLFGLVFIFNPNIINTFLSIIIGAWIILKSVTSIQISMAMRDYSKDRARLILIVSIVTLIVGIVMLFNPFASSILISACGFILLIFEFVNIVETISLIKWIK